MAQKLPRPLAIRLTPSGVMDRPQDPIRAGERERIGSWFCYSGRVELRLRVFFVEPETLGRCGAGGGFLEG